MGFDKQELIKGYLRTIEQNEEKIIEYSKPCDSSKRRIRALERDLLKKRNKELRKLRNWKMNEQELRTNKQELISKYELIKNSYNFDTVATDSIISDLKRLDEPEKVKVPQFVADWIEVCKEHLTTSLYTAMNPNFMKENNQSFDLILWIKKTSNQDLFARAWLDGYEVEEEKQYLVKIKATKHYLVKDGNGKIFFSLAFKGYFTKKELEEADFGWVFSCEGIDVEEVD